MAIVCTKENFFTTPDQTMTLKAFILLVIFSNSVACIAFSDTPSTPDKADEWYQQGQSSVLLNRQIALTTAKNITKTAKNIILFVGDGMGVSTVTAARIFAGQQQGKPGEENLLFFETLPYQALAKTYNTNQQTPDSAGTMTAMITGVKTKAAVISVSQDVTRGDCSTLLGNKLTTLLEHAEHIGMSTGIVSTARITHATPAATYAHLPERNFEDDADIKKLSNSEGCIDIASQMLNLKNRYGNGLEVALGGGRRSFIPKTVTDEEENHNGERLDHRDLTAEWLTHYPAAKYVWNHAQFDAINPDTTQHLLGLFSMSHMAYELDRPRDKAGEPSLTQMTEKAIKILQKNPKGYFLHVESGRIDHAHHAGNAKRALVDTVEFANAVKKAYEMTSPEDTLIIVTADHSHVFTIAGYPTRGNPILGKVISNDSAGNPKKDFELAQDKLPYTTLGYMNGRGIGQLITGGNERYNHPITAGKRSDLTHLNTEHDGFHQEALVPMGAETHGGEDVAIYASGPQAALIRGTLEQNVIFHVMDSAARLTERSGLSLRH